MKNIRLPNFFFTVFALILGSALYRNFDFETMSFEKVALNTLYAIVFIVCIVLIIRDYRKPPANK